MDWGLLKCSGKKALQRCTVPILLALQLTRGWVGNKCPEKKCYIILEWPYRDGPKKRRKLSGGGCLFKSEWTTMFSGIRSSSQSTAQVKSMYIVSTRCTAVPLAHSGGDKKIKWTNPIFTELHPTPSNT